MDVCTSELKLRLFQPNHCTNVSISILASLLFKYHLRAWCSLLIVISTRLTFSFSRDLASRMLARWGSREEHCLRKLRRFTHPLSLFQRFFFGGTGNSLDLVALTPATQQMEIGIYGKPGAED